MEGVRGGRGGRGGGTRGLGVLGGHGEVFRGVMCCCSRFRVLLLGDEVVRGSTCLIQTEIV